MASRVGFQAEVVGASGRPHAETALAVLAFSAIFLQKLGLSLAGGAIGIDAFILWGVLLWLLMQGQAVVDPLRAFLFVTMIVAVVLGLLLESFEGTATIGLPALLVFLSMYATMLVRIDVTRAEMLRCLDKFQVGMGCIAFIVIGQQVLQYTVGNHYWPNLGHLVPDFLLIKGYAYLRPYTWNSPYLTPNGIFFLEPSAMSGFMALALAAEIVWFKKPWRLGLFGLGLVAGIAGSGPTIVALFSPLLLRKMDRRLIKWVMGAGIPLLILGIAGGALSHLLDRSSEFSSDNSSAYARFVIPLHSTMALVSDPAYFITGNGPGSSPKGNNEVQWPINKLTYEYGLATAIAFHIFLLVATLRYCASSTLTLIVLVPHLCFGGGFVSHTNIMMLVIFGSLLRIKPEVRAALLPQTNRMRDDRQQA